jgi:prevent-host-death family protein
MAIIKPISDLRNKSNEISELAHSSREPIYITKNGEGDLVVMSIAHYRQMELKMDLFAKLAEAQAELASGAKPQLFTVAMKEIRRRIDGKKKRD